MKFLRAGIVLVLMIAFGSSVVMSDAQTKSWAVVVQNQTRPAQVEVTLLGTQQPPWQVDSVWHNDISAAWKKACWLVMKGDLVGRRYVAPQMQQRRVSCDANCNCKF